MQEARASVLPAPGRELILLSRISGDTQEDQEERQEEEMKWLKIIIALAEILIPGLAKAGKNKLADELEIAQGALKVATSSMSAEGKARLIADAVGNLKVAKKFKKRISNKLDKASVRLVKKFL